MSSKAIFIIASAIENELTEIDRARSVLQAAIEPLECVRNPETAEEKMFVMQNEHTVNLLHVTDSLLFGAYQELLEAQDSLYSLSEESDISSTEKGGAA